MSESFPLVPTPEKPGVRGGRALFSGNDKLIRRSDGRVELYDTRTDPGERRDLAGSPASAEAVSAAERVARPLDRGASARPVAGDAGEPRGPHAAARPRVPAMRTARVLGPGELHAHERFGADTVNRGAVLWECEWDGGVFESGVMLGGIFRAGEFRDGVVWAAYWKGGVVEGRLLASRLLARRRVSAARGLPGERSLPASRLPRARIDESARPRVTVFAASVFGDRPADLARLPEALAAGRRREVRGLRRLRARALSTASSCRASRCFAGRRSARTSRSRTATP